jgi:cell division cycle 20, cofactor of APC complex
MVFFLFWRQNFKFQIFEILKKKNKNKNKSKNSETVTKNNFELNRKQKNKKQKNKKQTILIMNNEQQTPSRDRFIPSRGFDVDLSQYSLAKENGTECRDDLAESDSSDMYRESLSQALWDKNPEDAKILRYKAAAPTPTRKELSKMRVLYSQQSSGANATANGKRQRVISQVPERILDAPELMDDFYVNPLDWSANNMLAVALGSAVYLWNATSGTIELLMETDKTNPICSVSWITAGSGYLALGTSDASVQLWDVESGSMLREMDGHYSRVSSLSWNRHILSSGGRDSLIVNHDVRMQEHQVQRLTGHEGEVCGLHWSPDLEQLASGSNDNTVRIWDRAMLDTSISSTVSKPLHTLTDHTAAVKAMAWCPWQRNLLATGGGTADRCIRFWNSSSGACLNTIDTESQVCSLLWSTQYKELVSSHGFSRNQLCVWKYPSMVRSAELLGHSQRVLHMAMSPDGETVVSASGDETLRFWKIFEAPKRTARTKKAADMSARKRKIKANALR